MSQKQKVYSEEERLYFLRDYYQSGLSKTSFCKRHNLCGVGLLNKWIAKYSAAEKVLSLRENPESLSDMSNRSKESYREENAQLKKRIKELEKALSFSRLETEARDLMITRAEEYFNVPIRKKSGAK